MQAFIPSPPARPVLLVGAGPGDPDLLTLRAVRALQSADVIVHDGLVDSRILAIANPRAELISVAKQRSLHSLPQEGINRLLVQLARSGRAVVRLKGGDPFIFGRGGEEADALRGAGVPVEIVPGVSAALGCAAATQMPLTHRDHASAVTFVAGQCKGLAEQNWTGLAGPGRTLVVYMGVAAAGAIAEKLIADGLPPETPAAIIENGTRPDMRLIQTRLDALEGTVADFQVKSPALLVIGEVAALGVHGIAATAPLAVAAE